MDCELSLEGVMVWKEENERNVDDLFSKKKEMEFNGLSKRMN